MKVLFVHQSMQSYVARDLAILRDAHEVRECEFVGMRNVSLLRLLADLRSLLAGVIWADLTFCWFGKLHAFFAVLFSKALRRKSLVVAGGEDVGACHVDGHPFGIYANSVKRRFGDFIFGNADCVLPVSRLTYSEALTNARCDPSKTQLVYHGFDWSLYQRLPNCGKERAVATIGNINSENWRLKRWDLFVEAASLLPELSFCLIGPSWEDSLSYWQSRVPDNVVLTGGLYDGELVEMLSRAAVYVQASAYESFGCALAEAMLCECVPVVTRAGALPEVVGDCGYYLDEPSPENLALAITEALGHPEMGQRARRRIIDQFPLTKRRDALLEIIERVAQA